MPFYTEVISNQPTKTFISIVLDALKAFGRGILNTFETMGRAKAAAELHRLGYIEEAKALMLQKN